MGVARLARCRLAAQPMAGLYVPRAPTTGVLYDIVRAHLTEFLAAVDGRRTGPVSRRSSSPSSGSSSAAACWRTASRGSGAATVRSSGWCPSRARAAGLSELWRAADGRARGTSRRSRVPARCARAAVGALGAAPAAVPPGIRPPAVPEGARRVRPWAAQRVSAAGPSRGDRRRRNRHGDRHPTVRRCAELARALPHARARRRVTCAPPTTR